MARRKHPIIPDALLDQLLAGTDAKAAFEKDGLLDELKKALAERVLNAEIDHHLEAGETDGRANSRNGYGQKMVLTDTGKIPLEVPRDRLSSFDPQLIAKYQRRFPGFDEKIVSMYARGMSTREIQGHLRELYGIDASADLISAVTDAVLEEVTDWQNRPLETLYPLIFFDALRIEARMPRTRARAFDGLRFHLAAACFQETLRRRGQDLAVRSRQICGIRRRVEDAKSLIGKPSVTFGARRKTLGKIDLIAIAVADVLVHTAERPGITLASHVRCNGARHPERNALRLGRRSREPTNQPVPLQIRLGITARSNQPRAPLEMIDATAQS